MAEPRIRVFVVDDHPMIRSGLAAVIDAEPDFERIGEADNGVDAVRLIGELLPDVVMMDIAMPRLDGIAAVEALHKRLPSTRFVILSSAVEPGEVRRAITAGANGYLLKNASALEMVNAIRGVHAGRRVLAPEAADAMIVGAQQTLPGADLTRRELEILTLMVRALNNGEIAEELSVAVPTVKFHITNILSKLGVENRTEAVLKALKHRLVKQG
jgi:two-component system, NarL family, response regulator LiaR